MTLRLLQVPGMDTTELIKRVFAHARQRVFDFARMMGQPVEEFKTTLIVVVAFRTGVVAGQVGDGLVVVQDPTGIRPLLRVKISQFG